MSSSSLDSPYRISSASTTDSMHTHLLLATRDNLVNIDIPTDNGRIFAPELKGHLFEHLTCLLYDFLPNKMWSW